jgi:hypothetical protein
MHRPALILSFLSCFVGVSLAILAALDALEADYRPTGLADIRKIHKQLGRLESARRREGEVRLVYQADSTGLRIPSVLQQEVSRLAPKNRRLKIYDLTLLGQSPFEYYFVSEQVVRARPDCVLMAINLGDFWGNRSQRTKHAEFVGWVPPGRLPEALGLRLEWLGLTLDRVLAYVALVQTGLGESWVQLNREQVRLDAWYRRAETLADAWAGLPKRRSIRVQYNQAVQRGLIHPDRRARASVSMLRDRYGPVLNQLDSEHPVLLAVEAVLRRYREAEIPVLVYVVPMNVEYMKQLEVYNETGLRRSIAVIADRARSTGAVFADLHDALPDAAFRDYVDHPEFEGEYDGVALTAARLASLIVEKLYPRVGAGD